MNAIAAWQQALNNATNEKSNNEINMLQSILDTAKERVVGKTTDQMSKQPLLRVQESTASDIQPIDDKTTDAPQGP